jgi:serine/threonine-protein kinase
MEDIRKGSRFSLKKGEWEVDARLGKGGFGAVYRARRDDGVEGAIKFVPKDPKAKRELLFVNLSEVDGVVPVIDDGETEQSWMLAMPEAECSLRERMDQSGRFGVEEVVEIVRDIASALDEIRNQGVVHRDIKPANVLRLDGKWCLADFGISRYIEATTSVDTRKYSLTPQYAAPEQWRSERASAATDIYALGVILYEMVAGRQPYGGPSVEDYREQHLHVTPAPLQEDVPPGLASLAIDCLSKSPGGRPSAKNFLRRLSRAQAVGEGGLAILQRASVHEASRRADADRDKELAHTAAEQRIELAKCGYEIYDRITTEVVDAIEDAVPSVQKEAPEPEWRKFGDDITFSLGSAKLSITNTPRGFTPYKGDPWRIPFDVVLYARIGLSFPGGHLGFTGKSNSLWYCDAEVRGEYAWYELGFAASPFQKHRSIISQKQPEAFDPGASAAKALSVGITDYMMAWPVTRLDAGDLDDFIDRWAGWFGLAADGKLQMPGRLPEVDVPRNWRR